MTPETKVTIAIPTYNRSELLKVSLQSALAQDYPDFQVLVLSIGISIAHISPKSLLDISLPGIMRFPLSSRLLKRAPDSLRIQSDEVALCGRQNNLRQLLSRPGSGTRSGC